MNHFIREIYPHETTRLAWLGGRLFWEAYKEVGDPQKIRSFVEHHYTAERFSDYLAKESTKIFVWEEVNEWRGYIMVTVPEPYPNAERLSKKAAKVNLLYIDQRFQRSGIGRLLLQQAERVSKKAGCDMLWLTVWPITKASEFYQRMGLKQIGEMPFEYPDGSTDLDWVMAKLLTSPINEHPGQDT